MGFSAVTFYLSLYLQEVKHQTALEITVKLLPMVVSGVLVNVICGLILHRVSNKVLTGIGALAYTASFLHTGHLSSQPWFLWLLVLIFNSMLRMYVLLLPISYLSYLWICLGSIC
jgi:predicted MFS family arabinose efflux permease